MTRLARLSALVGAIVVLSSAALFGATAFQVDRLTRPERHPVGTIDFETLLMEVRDVSFVTSDGVAISGWIVRGQPDRPGIVIAHDLGGSKATSAGLARRLMAEGFTLLLIDLRGHGESGGTRSTLGVHEKRDLLAAVEFLRESVGGPGGNTIGLYGVGMGAHAAVLAAAESPAVKVLVLDGLYPDPLYALTETLYPNWPFGRDRLGFLPSSVFQVISKADAEEQRASDVLGRMLGRDLLLLASEQDPRLGDEMKRMYNAFPQQRDVDGNLILLPATQTDGLYGDALTAYHERVTGFFLSRLRSRTGS